MSDIGDSAALVETLASSSGDQTRPELVFGIAGAIGVEIASICDSLSRLGLSRSRS